MEWKTVVEQLFPDGNEVRQEGDLLLGEGVCGEQTIAVIGTTNHTEVGVELALAMAAEVLAVIRNHPDRPILFLVDTGGQRLRHRDEMLGLNGYMAHLAKCVEMARRWDHPVISLVYEQGPCSRGSWARLLPATSRCPFRPRACAARSSSPRRM